MCKRRISNQFCIGLYFSFALWIAINLEAFPVRCWNIILENLVVLNGQLLLSPVARTIIQHN